MSQNADYPTLAEELAAQVARSAEKSTEEWKDTLKRARDWLASSGIEDRTLKEGDQAPMFELPDALGDTVKLEDLLQEGPVVISFYRGSWCPYCNLELRALQRTLEAFEESGTSLVAISPNRPDISRDLVEDLELEFPVLTDHDNQVARQFGIVYEMTAEHVDLYLSRGRDIREIHNTDATELPIPATYVVGRDGRIAYAHVDTDHRRRAEPSEVVEVASRLASQS